MSQIGIMRAIIEKALDKAFRDMEEDKERSIRNLVDLGAFFSKSALQKDFFDIAQKMLEDRECTYYKIITDAVERVEHENIKTFGINMGYNCWTLGAKKLRQFGNDMGDSIPWITIINAPHREDLPKKEVIRRTIEQRSAAGAECYLFMIDDGSDLDFLISVFRENRGCAFVIFAHPSALDEKKIIDIKKCRNTLFSIYSANGIANESFDDVMELLQKNKCFFSVHTFYDDDNASDILNGNFVKRAQRTHATFTFLIRSKNCSEQNAGKIQAYIKDVKTNQRVSTFLIDLYKDIDYVSRRISGGPFHEEYAAG